VAQYARFGLPHHALGGIGALVVLGGGLPAWLAILAASHSYESHQLGLGSDEYRHVANAAVRFALLVAAMNFSFKWGMSRVFVLVWLPALAVLALLLRFAARKVLHRLRRNGEAAHRVLVVGEGPLQQALVTRLDVAQYAGLRVVGACRIAPHKPSDLRDAVAQVRRKAARLGADTVAIAHSPSITPEVMRELAWSLEGSGVDLLVAPALTDVAGPRIAVRHVSGLPLLQVTEPRFTGPQRLMKKSVDLAASALGLLLLSPVLAVVAVLVKASSPGPVIFRQIRIGKNGAPFGIYKFRSMYVDAEARLAELRDQNDHGEDGVLFKLREDPRITPLGRHLRRFSLDELPQLVNVLLGSMSLVGPRPPLPEEVEKYERHVHRRLLVTPGVTGLWQVNGRSDLSWDESVRLDLYYVENWSVMLDIEIVWKTLAAVLRGAGAR
jgi:exopolysaccharide biosynthesis polyprenyl glycosylphosphotransferase